MKLAGKVAVVTGAGSGIGKAISMVFAQEGAKVVAADIRPESAQETVLAIEAKGGTAIAAAANVAVEQDVQRMIDTAVETYGTLDILVNNAGITDGFVPVADITDEHWDRVLAVNTTGPMRTIRKALPIFIGKGGGVIVNIASVAGLHGSRAGIAYTAAKFAVVGMTKNVGYQYGRNGVRCNAIAPGGVRTNIGVGAEIHKAGKEMTRGPGWGREGSAEEVARIALFLSCDDSSFINGEIVTADGGWTAF